MSTDPQHNRLPPHDLNAEACTVGSLLLAGNDRKLIHEIRQTVRTEDFYLADNGIIFGAACRAADSGKPIDAVIVMDVLKASKEWAEVGGVAYVKKLLNTVPDPSHGPHYAAIVADSAKRRTAIAVASGLAAKLYERLDRQEADDTIERAQRVLSDLARVGRQINIWTIGDIVTDTYDRISRKETDNLEIGIQDIDDFGGFLTRGGYTILGGRPSMGKSTIARWMLRQAAGLGIRCGLIALEEGRGKIGQNYLSAESGIENERLARPASIQEYEWTALAGAAAKLGPLPIMGVDDAFELRDVLAAYHTLAVEKQCKLIVVDHCHLLGLANNNRRENRNAELTEISRQLKRIIKQTNTVGIVVAQLSRPEKKQGDPGAPTMRDLRDSGSLEQDADAIALVHRPAYYAVKDECGKPVDADIEPHRCDIHIVKVRNGPTGIVVLTEDLRCQRFFAREPQAF